jgi:hypothetical protein
MTTKEKNNFRKIELTEKDFLRLSAIKDGMKAVESIIHTLMKEMDEILDRHTVRDITWRGQVIPFEKKKLKKREG